MTSFVSIREHFEAGIQLTDAEMNKIADTAVFYLRELLSFFAPEPSYATDASRERGAQAVVDEFRGMVSLLHQAGIEVILDVVYNHTCEGGDAGPSLSWRGLDSDLYYRHTSSRPVQTIDVTGTGNTVNMDHPKSIQMVMDSLRYWVREKRNF